MSLIVTNTSSHTAEMGTQVSIPIPIPSISKSRAFIVFLCVALLKVTSPSSEKIFYFFFCCFMWTLFSSSRLVAAGEFGGFF